MNSSLFSEVQRVLTLNDRWRERWQPYTTDPVSKVDPDVLNDALLELERRLADNYPFFHPTYAGQMLKPPHEAALLGYLAAMLINPNNHALDGGPATGQMEKEVVRDIATMFGYGELLGHLTSSGTIANLEALWVSRELRPGRAVAYSSQAHYTHRRMCNVLGIRGIEVPCESHGRMDTAKLEQLCLSEDIGTVVATLGTTGMGALDPLPDLLALGRRQGFRVHVDAAYGGFYRLLAEDKRFDGATFRAMNEADSIVVDPHKHGLQPYGCGCVLFRDPSVARFYKHDSPYTYFTSDELHLGEISLECSRAGASAAALWLTLQCFPLAAEGGLGAVLSRCRDAALDWAQRIRASSILSLLLEPELDIVVFFPLDGTRSASAISENSSRTFVLAMNDPDRPVYLSKLRVPSSLVCSHYPDITADAEWTTVLRSALMKPEHAAFVPTLHDAVEHFARMAVPEE